MSSFYDQLTHRFWSCFASNFTLFMLHYNDQKQIYGQGQKVFYLLVNRRRATTHKIYATKRLHSLGTTFIHSLPLYLLFALAISCRDI